MPTRSSRSSSSDHKGAIAYHAASITMLWVVVLLMSIGVWLVLLVDMMRLDRLDTQVTMIAQDFAAAQQMMQSQPPTSAPMIPAQPPANAPMIPAQTPTSTVPPTPGTSTLPGLPGGSTSPSGLLDRGSLSPDGTKFAGFDDTTAGKIGIAVEIVATKDVKHIVIFNPNTESTGKGTPQEGDLSVRWTDNSNIQYDELVKQNGQWVKQTKSVEIYF